jgi:hypothetical protein
MITGFILLQVVRENYIFMWLLSREVEFIRGVSTRCGPF